MTALFCTGHQAHIVRVKYIPDAACPEGEEMVYSFSTASAAIEFIKRQHKKPSVKIATYEGEKNASRNF